MTDLEYLDHAERLLKAVELACDRINDSTDADKDLARQWIAAKAQPVAAGNPFD